MINKNVAFIITGLYLNPLTLYIFKYVYRGIEETVIYFIMSAISSLFLIIFLNKMEIFLRRHSILLGFFATVCISILLAITGQMLFSDRVFTYAHIGYYVIFVYIMTCLVTPTLWLNIFILALHFFQRKNNP